MIPRHLVIFARAPRLGLGKRRLAADIGRIAAWRFYRAHLRALTRRLSQGPWRMAVAVADPCDLYHPAFDGVPVFPQPAGDLGQRMAGTFRQLASGPALIVGSDVPDIRPLQIAQAFDALRTRDVVFGPAFDGGYWLVGLARRRPLPRDFMTGVRWSTPQALDDTIATLPTGTTVARIDPLDDVDDGPSYLAYVAGGGRCR